jgi:hypothetical protein
MLLIAAPPRGHVRWLLDGLVGGGRRAVRWRVCRIFLTVGLLELLLGVWTWGIPFLREANSPPKTETLMIHSFDASHVQVICLPNKRPTTILLYAYVVPHKQARRP